MSTRQHEAQKRKLQYVEIVVDERRPPSPPAWMAKPKRMPAPQQPKQSTPTAPTAKFLAKPEPPKPKCESEAGSSSTADPMACFMCGVPPSEYIATKTHPHMPEKFRVCDVCWCILTFMSLVMHLYSLHTSQRIVLGEGLLAIVHQMEFYLQWAHDTGKMKEAEAEQKPFYQENKSWWFDDWRRHSKVTASVFSSSKEDRTSWSVSTAWVGEEDKTASMADKMAGKADKSAGSTSEPRRR